MKIKIWHGLAVAAIIGMAYPTYQEFFPSEEEKPYIAAVKPVVAVKTSAQPTSAVKPNAQNALATQEPALLPPRVLNVPSYDKVILASRIINEAVNQDAAENFVRLQETRRNAKIQADIGRLMTEVKEAEAGYYNASAKVTTAKLGKVTPEYEGNGISSTLSNFSTANNVVDASVGLNADGTPKILQPQEKIIRLAQLDKQRKEMIIQMGSRWYSSVKAGQTIEGYYVGKLDMRLQCVPLIKDKKTEVICLN